MKLLFACVAILLLVSCSHEPDLPDDLDRCESSDDCVLVERGGCCRTWEGINRQYEQSWNEIEWDMDQCELVDCAKQLIPDGVACENRLCVLHYEVFS